MFEAVRKNKRISQVILAIIIVPFAFFGMDAYFSDNVGGGEVASVGGSGISVVEFDRALRTQQDRVRENLGEQFDRALVDTPAFRRSVLESLINQRVLAVHAEENRMTVTSQQLQNVIGTLPAFQGEGGFSLERYERSVRAQGMTPSVFEARLAQDLRVQQIVESVGGSAFGGETPVKRLLLAQLEERSVRTMTFGVEQFEEQVTLDEEALRAFYEENPARFERPARLRAEYVVFDQDAVLDNLNVEDGQVEAFYEANRDRFGQPEERRARHILIRLADDADAQEVEAARARAEEIREILANAPERFEELARSESEDPGSAASGGDLGFFGPGAMVEAFEEVAFALEPGEISEVVRSDFGFHIIEVTAINPATVRPLDEVRDEIVNELKSQEARTQFAVLAEQFANTVYEQPDSLEPAAAPLGLEVHTTDWITPDGNLGGYNDERLVRALFSAETRETGENIEAIEVERGTLISARVVDYEAAQQRPFEEVRGEIEDQLRAREAAQLARERGEEALATLVGGGEVEGEWSDPTTVQRGNPSLPTTAMKAVFEAASSPTLPAYVGAVLPEGDYQLFMVESISRPELDADDPRLQAVSEQYGELIAAQDFAAYVAALRQRYGVEIHASAFEASEQ